MCRMRKIVMRDCQESVTTGQTHTRTDGQTPDKIPMCPCASQGTQKWNLHTKRATQSVSSSIITFVLNAYYWYKNSVKN